MKALKANNIVSDAESAYTLYSLVNLIGPSIDLWSQPRPTSPSAPNSKSIGSNGFPNGNVLPNPDRFL